MVTVTVTGRLKVLAVKRDTRLCSQCFALTERDPCDICTDAQRTADVICVVEEPADLLAIERAREYRGRYHVLHGTLAPLDGIGPDDLKIEYADVMTVGRALEGRREM